MELTMKVHQFARGFSWEHEPSLSLGCSKRLRPLVPKLQPTTPNSNSSSNSNSDTTSLTTFDLKSFIRPDSGPRKLTSTSDEKQRDSPQLQVETHPGGTRWNPTQEQIGILEMLYRRGMRTPNAHQIEQITAQLGKYGKIEGKNVFYWFQNHKARERQKQKRNSLGLTQYSPRTPPQLPLITTTIPFDTYNTRGERLEREEDSAYKRKCMSWDFECLVEDSSIGVLCKKEDGVGDRTLELFPLHPEGRS